MYTSPTPSLLLAGHPHRLPVYFLGPTSSLLQLRAAAIEATWIDSLYSLSIFDAFCSCSTQGVTGELTHGRTKSTETVYNRLHRPSTFRTSAVGNGSTGRLPTGRNRRNRRREYTRSRHSSTQTIPLPTAQPDAQSEQKHANRGQPPPPLVHFSNFGRQPCHY